MLPYVEIFGRVVPMYGLLAAAGALLAILYIKLTAPGGKVSADEELAAVWGAVGCFVGAKALYILTVLPDIAAAPQLLVQRWLLGGFVFYGGLYGTLAGAYIYCRAAKAPVWDIFARLLPAIPLVHCFGRLGCFCTGCCYGVECESFGVAFTASAAAPNGVKLLPVQLIEAAWVFILFAVLARMSAKGCSGKRMLGVYLLAYSLFRFVLEFFRGDAARGFILNLSTSQLIAAVSVIFAAALLRQAGKKESGHGISAVGGE